MLNEVPPEPDDSISHPVSQGTEPTRWFAYIAVAIPIVSGVGGLIYMGWMIYVWVQRLFSQ